MADNKSKTGPQDSKRVNIHERYELDYWSEHLGTTRDRLKAAVEAVGPMADDVRQHLQKT